MNAGSGRVPKDEIKQFILRLGGGAKLLDKECELISRLHRIDRHYSNVGLGIARIDRELRTASARIFVPLAGGVLEPSWTATVTP